MLYLRSNGKLMITGEYLVLAGASALAMPVKYGQTLKLRELKTENKDLSILWQTHVKESEKFRVTFSGQDLQPVEQATEKHSYPVSAASRKGEKNNLGAGDDTEEQSNSINYVRNTLLAAKRIRPEFLVDKSQWHAVSNIEFDMAWGLGSSSSLISNIALWAGIDPYELFFAVSEGSGYDIACARSNQPLLYTFRGRNEQPEVQTVDFHPPFSDHLVFVYSGKKQDSAKSIKKLQQKKFSPDDVEAISSLSEAMAWMTDLRDFMSAMAEHEEIIAGCTGMEPVQSVHYPDFPGAIKSLGAWGGDFLLAASPLKGNKIIDYFRRKGANVIIPFEEMCIQNQS